MKFRWETLIDCLRRLTVFNLLEKSDGSLTEMTKEMNKRYFSDESLATLPKKRNTFLDEFWWGNNIKIKKYWNAYYSGDKFMYQYFSHDSFILEISFKDKPKEYPLFNIEPIIKTLQSYNSYLEKESLLEDKPDIGNPLLLQEISRGSEILTFVGFYGSIIGLLVLYEKYKGQRLNNALAKKKIDGQSLSNDLARSKIEGQKLKNLDDAIEILEKRYPKIYANYQKNKLPKELSEALQNLISEGVSKVAISRKPMNKDDFDGSKNDLDEFEI